MNKEKRILTQEQIDSMEQLSINEQIITDPSVKLAFYTSVYKSPNNNAWQKGVVNFNRISLASERLLNMFTGDRLVIVGRGLGEKTLLPEGMLAKARIIICMLIDQQINDDLIINEGRVSRDFSGGGISYSEAANKFSNPYDTTFEAVRSEIRKSGLVHYLEALESEQEEAGVIFNPDGYLRLNDYTGGKGTAYQKDNSRIGLYINDLEGVGLPEDVVGDGTTRDSLDFLYNMLTVINPSTLMFGFTDPNTNEFSQHLSTEDFSVEEGKVVVNTEKIGADKVEALKDLDDEYVTELAESFIVQNGKINYDLVSELESIANVHFGDGTNVNTQNKAINSAVDLPITPITKAKIINATNVQGALEELDAKAITNNDLITNLSGEVDIVETTLENNTTNISNIQSDLVEVHEDLTILEDKINDDNDKITELQLSSISLGDAIDEANEVNDEQEIRIDNNDIRLNNLESLIKQNSNDNAKYTSPNGSITETPTLIVLSETDAIPFDDTDIIEFAPATSEFIIKQNMNFLWEPKASLTFSSGPNTLTTIQAKISGAIGDSGTYYYIAEESQEFRLSPSNSLDNQSMIIQYKARNIAPDDPTTWLYIKFENSTLGNTVGASNVKHFFEYTLLEQATGVINKFSNITNDTIAPGVDGKEVIDGLVMKDSELAEKDNELQLLKQNITDTTLETTDKTIVGAINELNSRPTNGTTSTTTISDPTTEVPSGTTATTQQDLNKLLAQIYNQIEVD